MSRFKKDSLVYSLWEEELYELELPVTLNDEKQGIFRFSLKPNGEISIIRYKDYLKYKTALPIFYIEKDEKP